MHDSGSRTPAKTLTRTEPPTVLHKSPKCSENAIAPLRTEGLFIIAFEAECVNCFVQIRGNTAQSTDIWFPPSCDIRYSGPG